MKIKKSSAYKAFTVFNFAFMILIIVIMLYPYLSVLAKAFNESADTARGGITIFPRKWTLDNFKTIIGEASFIKSVIVSVTRVFTGVVLGLYVQFTAAYALTRKKFPFKGFILMLFVIPMYISAGQIPIYVLYSKIKLLNTFWVYILPVLFSFYNITIIRTYMQTTIPESLYESAFLSVTEFSYSFKGIPEISAVDHATKELSPCSPSTYACTCFWFTEYNSERRVLKRMLSSVVPVPITRFLGTPVILQNT